MDWQTAIALAALGVAVIGLASQLFGKSLTRNEHAEFKDAIRREFDVFKEAVWREIDRLFEWLDKDDKK